MRGAYSAPSDYVYIVFKMRMKTISLPAVGNSHSQITEIKILNYLSKKRIFFFFLERKNYCNAFNLNKRAQQLSRTPLVTTAIQW